MGNEPSVFESHGYSQIRKEQGFDVVRTKEGNQYLVRPIKKDVAQVNHLLGRFEHPHVVRHQSFQGKSNVLIKGL